MTIIEVASLRKEFKVAVRKSGRWAAIRSLFAPEYDHRVAVEDISFTMEPGEIVGYVGPNGAGKSTSIKMLTGILVPTAGEVRVAGLVPHQQREDHARHIGVVFGQKTQLWWDVPVSDSLRLLREIYKIPLTHFRTNLELFNDLLDLHEFQILTTHDMADVEKLCSRVIVIDHGRIFHDGDLKGLQEQYAPFRELVVDFADEQSGVSPAGVELVEQRGRQVRFRFDRRQISASALIADLAGRYGIEDVHVENPDIEAVIRKLYSRSTIERHADQSQ